MPHELSVEVLQHHGATGLAYPDHLPDGFFLVPNVLQQHPCIDDIKHAALELQLLDVTAAELQAPVAKTLLGRLPDAR